MTLWLARGLGLLVLYVVLLPALVWLDFAPDPWRLALLVSLGSSVAFVVWDSLGDSGPAWNAAVVRPMLGEGSDLRLAGFVRLIESHLTAGTPDTGLRDRLAALCDARLAQRHGLTRHDAAAAALLGADLLRTLDHPARRMTRAEIDRHLERIENL